MKKRNIDLRKFLNKYLHHRGWEVEDYETNAKYLEKERDNCVRRKDNKSL